MPGSGSCGERTDWASGQDAIRLNSPAARLVSMMDDWAAEHDARRIRSSKVDELLGAWTSIAFFRVSLKSVQKCHARSTIMGHRALCKMAFRVAACGTSHFPLQARTTRSVDCFLAKRTISAAGFPRARTNRTCK